MILFKLLALPITAPAAGIRYCIEKVVDYAEQQLTDDAPVREQLLELQIELEEGRVTDEEYTERETVLLARLRALLRRSGRSEPVVYTAGDLKVDPITHRCLRGDVEVTLTAREFAVLEFLMRRAGEVIPKSEILDNVWDFAFEGDPNIVEVYIRHLRRKLDEPFDRQLIQTIRGAGYRLDPAGG